MIEKRKQKTTLTLDHERGNRFVLFGNNIAATGLDLSYPKELQQETDQDPTKSPRSSFWLEEPKPDEMFTPLTGVRKVNVE